MTIPRPIFGLRFRSNVELQPTPEELAAFLGSRKTENGKERQGSDLERYAKLLNDIVAFRQARQQDPIRQDIRSRMYYGVLGHSHLFNQSLLSAVELFKYLLHDLQTLDLKKPSSFIRAAEEEIGRLNPKKRDQAAKRERLLVMVNERKELLAKRTRRKTAATDELVNIGAYVRDSLERITELCEASVTVLRDFWKSRETERRLIEDIKLHFKEQIRDSLHHGPVTKQYLETLQREVSLISQELTTLIEHDVNALIGLYRSIQDHARTVAAGLTSALTAFEDGTDRMGDAAGEVYQRMAQLLSTLVADYRLELNMTEPRVRTVYPSILLEKRREALDEMLGLATRERRAARDRRANRERRLRTAAGMATPERRSGKDRRTGKERRKPADRP